MRFNNYPVRTIARWSLAPLSVLAVASCGSEDSSSDTPSTAATAAAPAERVTTTNLTTDERPMITFDYLGGGSQVILVYPGVTDSDADKKYNGTYYHGEQMPALCQTIGRMVTSDPSVGELEKNSDVWIKIVDQPGESGDQYATLVYTTAQSPADLPGVPQC